MFTPSTMRARASSPKRDVFGCHCLFLLLIWCDYFSTTADEVFFAHHQELVAVDLDGLAAVLAEQDPVADLDVERR